ncbi:T9SS type A sorting domain-containing protein [bacterium]|nr:T9SS type A sorting domain-containing protein [bacterium]
MKIKIQLMVPLILIFSQLTFSVNFELYSSGRFPMANIKSMTFAEYDVNNNFAITTQNGFGVLNDNNNNLTLNQHGTTDPVISQQILAPAGEPPFLYYIQNPGGYSSLNRINLNTSNIVSFWENNIIGQVSYSGIEGDSRTYAINLSGDVICINSNFNEQNRSSGALGINPQIKRSKIIKNPLDHEIFYFYQPNEWNFDAIDVRTSKGKEYAPSTNQMFSSYPIIDACIVQFQSAIYNTQVLTIADNTNKIKIYTFAAGNTNVNLIAEVDYSANSGGFNAHSITGDSTINYKMWLCVPENNQILQINFGLTGITFTSIAVNNLKFIYAHNGKLYVFRNNLPMEIYSLPLSGSDTPIDYNTNVEKIKVVKTKDYFIAYNNLGTGIINGSADINDSSLISDFFTAYSGIPNWLKTNNGLISLSAQANSNFFAVKDLTGVSVSQTTGIYSTSFTQLAVEDTYNDISLQFDSKVYTLSAWHNGIIMQNLNGSDTATYSFSVSAISVNGMKYDEINNYLIGFYDTSGEKRLFIFDSNSNNWVYDGPAPMGNIVLNGFCLDPTKSMIFVSNSNYNYEIDIFDYSNPASPDFLGLLFNDSNRAIIQKDIVNGRIITTDYDGINYYIHFYTLDNEGYITNTETFPWITNYNSVSAEFSVYENKILASLGNGYYDIYEYKAGAVNVDPADYDFYPFPNPTDGMVNIAYLPEGSEIRIYTLNGFQIYRKTDLNGTFTIDLNDFDSEFQLNTGKYYVYIKSPQDDKPIIKPLYFKRREK